MKLHAHRDPLGKINFYPERDGLGALLTLFRNGDRLLFYTDGLVETRDRAGRFFELDHQVAAALARVPTPGRAVLPIGMLYIAPILANVVSDGHGEHSEQTRGPSPLLASQEAVPAARHRDHGRRRDGGHDLGPAFLRQDRLGAAR